MKISVKKFNKNKEKIKDKYVYQKKTWLFNQITTDYILKIVETKREREKKNVTLFKKKKIEIKIWNSNKQKSSTEYYINKILINIQIKIK